MVAGSICRFCSLFLSLFAPGHCCRVEQTTKIILQRTFRQVDSHSLLCRSLEAELSLEVQFCVLLCQKEAFEWFRLLDRLILMKCLSARPEEETDEQASEESLLEEPVVATKRREGSAACGQAREEAARRVHKTLIRIASSFFMALSTHAPRRASSKTLISLWPHRSVAFPEAQIDNNKKKKTKTRRVSRSKTQSGRAVGATTTEEEQ